MNLLPLAVSIAVAGPFAVVATPPPAPTAPADAAAIMRSVVADSAPRTVSRTDSTELGEAALPWSAPVAPLRVARAFDAPAQKWLPGHRGVDVRAAAGTSVAAPAPGRVAFVGMVASRPVISVDHADPRVPGGVIRTTYEPVRGSLAAGDSVTAGDTLGVVADDSHCGGGCLHWGARRGETYVDPLTFLRQAVRLWPPGQRTG